MNVEIDKITESVKVAVYSQHVIRGHSVVITLHTSDDNPLEVWNHFLSPELALNLLAQLEQKRETLEAMVKE